jgi:hypothetical protein
VAATSLADWNRPIGQGALRVGIGGVRGVDVGVGRAGVHDVDGDAARSAGEPAGEAGGAAEPFHALNFVHHLHGAVLCYEVRRGDVGLVVGEPQRDRRSDPAAAAGHRDKADRLHDRAGRRHVHPSTAGIRDLLAGERRASTETLRDRLARGQADGDVPLGADIGALTGYVSTVQFGLSMQARDGATREELSAVVDCAMAALDPASVRPSV